MRSILVNADRKPGSDARLQTAIDIARRADGHVTVLVDTPVSRYIAMDPMGGSYVMGSALDDALGADDAVADAAEARLAATGIPFEVMRCEDDPVTAFAYAARLADLIIVSRSDGLAGELALRARAPVLALSDEPLGIPLGSACIGWDGGEPAAAALRAAAPLLAGCSSVRLICVVGSGSGFPAHDALRYLARYGIHAEIEEHERGSSTQDTLAAAVGGSDLLVMGAYGKSRVREFLFGGVTDHFLNEDTAPALLLAH